MNPNQSAQEKPPETTEKASNALSRSAAQRKRARKHYERNQWRHNLILAGISVIAICLIWIAFLSSEDRAFSDAENRPLAQFPTLTWNGVSSGSYFENLENWFNDQFPLRDRAISLHLCEIEWLGEQESGGVYLGKEDRLLAAPEEPQEGRIERTVSAIDTFTSAHPEISSHIMLVPDAASIMTQDLPKNAPVRDQVQDVQSILGVLNTDITVLNASDTLLEHSTEDIYYKTDHHWTCLGAYYAYTANIDALDIRATAESFDIYTVTNDFEGTLASKSGSHAVHDSIQIYGLPENSSIKYYVTYNDGPKLPTIYDRSALEGKDKYTIFFGGNHAKVEIRTTVHNGKSLLLFKDSYANCFVQFLLPSYEKIIMIDPRYYYDSLDSVLNSGITDILYLYSADTIMADTSLADVLESG